MPYMKSDLNGSENLPSASLDASIETLRRTHQGTYAAMQGLHSTVDRFSESLKRTIILSTVVTLVSVLGGMHLIKTYFDSRNESLIAAQKLKEKTDGQLLAAQRLYATVSAMESPAKTSSKN